MGFRKEVRRFIADTRVRWMRRDSDVYILTEVNKNLREQNKDLLDRLMARNFEELQVYRARGEIEDLGTGPAPDQDADLAGEVLDLEEVKEE
jgi:hypothetical protein